MAYLKPGVFMRRVFNPLAMRFGIGGAVTLMVPDRSSGELQQLPIVPVEHDGGRYLVSVRGESEWVHNVRAAGGGELRTNGGSKPFRATEIPVEERPPVIAAYRESTTNVDSYFEKLPDPADHPVFRIDEAP
jgi:hypothetical protein